MKNSARYAMLVVILALLTAFCGCAVKPNEEGSIGTKDLSAEVKHISLDGWNYNEGADVYWKVGINYCSAPADAKYATLGVYVPGEYFIGKENKDGTYTVEINADGECCGYKAETAPIVFPVDTPGYMAMTSPMGYSSQVKEYTDAGFVYIAAGCRGRDSGAPAGVTDLKAAIRFIRYNDGIIPGCAERIFSFGMSGGGAQSALIGATGNSELYEPYLEQIGALSGYSDAVFGSMCWCPITGLDVANEAYEWNMGITRQNIDIGMREISDAMALSFAEYINKLALKDENGNVLSLEESDEGIYQQGSYYDYIKNSVETSLNNFLSDTEFPHTVEKERGFGRPGIGGGENNGGIKLEGTYETVDDYIAALNAENEWVIYDSLTKTATITSVSDFAKALKTASKAVGAFDSLSATQGENILFGYGDGKGAHFDAFTAAILGKSSYSEAFAADFARLDSVGNTVDVRVDMYNPMYYLCDYYKGNGTSDVAQVWRIRSGINQGDTALTTEINLALALQNAGYDVDFAAVWGKGHTEAERVGSAPENFIAWVNECFA